jgi:DNA repair protein RadC
VTRLAAGELRMTLARADAPDPAPSLSRVSSPTARTVEIRYPRSTGGMPILRTAADVGEYLTTTLADVLDDPREHAYVLAMTTKNRLMVPPYLLAIGTDGSCQFHPKEVLRFAVMSGARSIIVAHSHPSGNCIPSPEDLEITKRLHQACDLLDTGLLDHVILAGCHRAEADRKWFSFREAGLL